MLITYKEYMSQKLRFEEMMSDTKRRESDCVKAAEEARQQINSQLFEEFLEKKALNNHTHQEEIREIREGFKTERREIHEKMTILTCAWKGQLARLESGEISREDIFPEEEGGSA